MEQSCKIQIQILKMSPNSKVAFIQAGLKEHFTDIWRCLTKSNSGHQLVLLSFLFHSWFYTWVPSARQWRHQGDLAETLN